MRKHRRIHDAYRFPGFRPVSIVRGIFGDPKARILRLERRGKKLCAAPAAWQRLKPFETFAAMVERNRSGIAAYCESEEKVSLGFVEDVNTKIQVIQRRAYGFRDEEYLRLKILTCMLPEI